MSKAKAMAPYVLAGLGVAGAYLSSKENRDKAMGTFNLVKSRMRKMFGDEPENADLLEKAGHPDPHDIEDAKMVGEGAMYSVDYYNNQQEQA